MRRGRYNPVRNGPTVRCIKLPKTLGLCLSVFNIIKSKIQSKSSFLFCIFAQVPTRRTIDSRRCCWTWVARNTLYIIGITYQRQVKLILSFHYILFLSDTNVSLNNLFFINILSYLVQRRLPFNKSDGKPTRPIFVLLSFFNKKLRNAVVYKWL